MQKTLPVQALFVGAIVLCLLAALPTTATAQEDSTCRGPMTDTVCCFDGTPNPAGAPGAACEGEEGGTIQRMRVFEGTCGVCGSMRVVAFDGAMSCDCRRGGGGGGDPFCDPELMCCVDPDSPFGCDDVPADPSQEARSNTANSFLTNLLAGIRGIFQERE
jgi:hypothetical protein